ncbi:MAG: PKD domain-containing protein [Chitinivibrionales bacterium]|nr:PKD domain-containing protein [Chitinivibrionales bacterium]
MKKRISSYNLPVFMTIISTVLTAVFLVCVPQLHNPEDPDYQGDYQLKVKMDPIEKVTGNRFELLSQYTLSIDDAGKDKFSTIIALTATPNSTVQDTVTFLYDKDNKNSTICFDRLITNKQLLFRGVQPNQNCVDTFFKNKALISTFLPFQLNKSSCTLYVAKKQMLRIEKIGEPVIDSAQSKKARWTVRRKGSSAIITDSLKRWHEKYFFSTTNPGEYVISCEMYVELKSDKKNPIVSRTVSLPPCTVSVSVGKPSIDSVKVNGLARLGDKLDVSFLYYDADSNGMNIIISAHDTAQKSDVTLYNSDLGYTTNPQLQLQEPIRSLSIDTFTIFAHGKCGQSDTFKFTCPIDPDLPDPYFLQETVTIPINQYMSIDVQDTSCSQTNGLLYKWRAKSGKNQENVKPYFTVRYDSVYYDTVLVIGTKYNYIGDSATICINASEYPYWIEPVVFPENIIVKRGTLFKVLLRDKNGPVDLPGISYQWIIDPITSLSSIDTIAQSATITAKDSIVPKFLISVKAFRNQEKTDSTPPFKKLITIRYFKPWVKFPISRFKVKTETTFRCTVATGDVNSDGTISKLLWKLSDKNSEEETTEPVWTHTFEKPGDYTLSVRACDNDSFLSDSAQALITVFSNKPIIYSVSPKSVIKDIPALFKCITNQKDVEFPITAWKWKFTGHSGIPQEKTTAADTMTFALIDTGKIAFAGSCIDKEGSESPVFYDTLSSDPAVPEILHFSIRNPESTKNKIYVKDTCVFNLKSRDRNERRLTVSMTIDGIGQILTKDDTCAKINDTIYTEMKYAFEVTKGDKNFTIRMIVKDKNGFSDTVTENIFVELGAPEVKEFTKKNDKVYIRESVAYTIKASDNDRRIDSFEIDWSGIKQTIKETIKDTTVQINHTFDSAGTKTISIIAYDKDGIRSKPFTGKVTIDLGQPSVESLIISSKDSVKTLFCNKDIIFQFKASDPDKYVYKIYAGFNTDSLTDSLVNNGSVNPFLATISHRYTIKEAGEQIVRYLCVDNYSVSSPKYQKTITINPGYPILKGYPDTEDTLLVVVDSNFKEYRVYFRSADSNGTVLRHYWSQNPMPDSSAGQKLGTQTFFMRNIGSSDLEAVSKIYLMAVDDDKLVTSRQFWLCADSIPPKPDCYDASITGNGVQFTWKGCDRKDGDQTQYEIRMDKGNAEPTTIFMDFKAGADLKINDSLYQYSNSITTGAGDYYWKVIAKDTHGSESEGIIHKFSFTPKGVPVFTKRRAD